MRGRVRRQLWVLTFVVLGVLLYRFGAVPLLRKAGAPDLAQPFEVPERGEAVRLVTWNLKNFVKPRATPELAATLAALDADLIAFQEIRNPIALQKLLPGHTLLATVEGGRGGQRLAVAFRPGRMEVLDGPHELESLSMGGPVRPGYHLQVRALPSGPDFHLMVVHLKARPEGHPIRTEQWSRLVDELRRIVDGEEKDIVVLGDFNTAGGADVTPEGELAALDAALGTVGLRRLPLVPGCTAYWDGATRDADQEPAVLDHVFVGDLLESLDASATAAPLAHCAQHQCQPFRSSRGHPEPAYLQSDHCPVMVDLRAADDDG